MRLALLGGLLAISYGFMFMSPSPTMATALDCSLKTDIADFNLYTKGNPTRQNVCNVTCTALKSTMIIIHGFNTDSTSSIWRLKYGVFNHFPQVENVIEVDWQSASKGLFKYRYIAANTVPEVYENVFNLLVFLRERGCRHIGMVGHSLGAHISGNAARIYKEVYNSSSSVDLIIGLDPAGPSYDKLMEARWGIMFTYSGKFRRRRRAASENSLTIKTFVEFWNGGASNRYLVNGLSKDDATRVIVFQTDTVCYGIDKNLGDHDIYLNGGYGQPGCYCFLFFCWLNKQMGCAIPGTGCSHRYAVEMFNTWVVAGRVPDIYPDLRLSHVNQTQG